jgi:hypothetical protein
MIGEPVPTSGLPPYESITPEYIHANVHKIVWLRDDYLSMMYYEKRPHVLAFLEHVYRVKQQARRDGMRFAE